MVFDGSRFRRVLRLSKIPPTTGDKVYLDVVPAPIYNDVLMFLRRRVRVFRLKNTANLREVRDENNLAKNDENVAMLLLLIIKDSFTEVTTGHVKLMTLIHDYYNHLKVLKIAKQMKVSKTIINLTERVKNRLTRQIQ